MFAEVISVPAPGPQAQTHASAQSKVSTTWQVARYKETPGRHKTPERGFPIILICFKLNLCQLAPTGAQSPTGLA